MKPVRIAWWGLVVLAVVVGCGARKEYVVTTLDLHRTGWDTLEVEVAFGHRYPFGSAHPIEPQATTIYLFDADYDTLYAGTDARIPVDDHHLGDQEPLLVEVCGVFEVLTLCEQAATTASPKRLRLTHDIAFPEGAAFDEGRYNLRFVAERQMFDSTAWEPGEAIRNVEGYLLAYVGEHRDEAVRVPFSRNQGRFNLKRHANFDDFQYRLKSRLLDDDSAAVHFDVYAGFEGQPATRLASIEKYLQSKSEDERLEDVYTFVERAARRLLDVLRVDRDERVRAYVDDWKFNALARTYIVEMEVVWRSGGRFFGRSYTLAGVLDVHENGHNAHFRLTHTNDRGGRRWRDYVDDRSLPLGTLETTPDEPDADAVGSLY